MLFSAGTKTNLAIEHQDAKFRIFAELHNPNRLASLNEFCVSGRVGPLTKPMTLGGGPTIVARS